MPAQNNKYIGFEESSPKAPSKSRNTATKKSSVYPQTNSDIQTQFSETL